MKILLPYTRFQAKASAHIYYDRANIEGGIEAYVFFNPLTNKWIIDTGEEPLPNTYDTAEEAMKILDAMLVADGWTLLDSEEQANKYRLML